MPSRSDGARRPPIRKTRTIVAVAALAVVAVPILAAFVNTSQYLVPEGRVEREDQYVIARNGFVDGTVLGDLTIATGNLTVNGSIDGDLTVLASGKVSVAGDVTGSLRGVAREVVVTGSVGDDAVMASLDTTVRGRVGRDVLLFGANARFEGEVGGNVRGQIVSVVLDGPVGEDVDISVQSLRILSGTDVAGDLEYRSTNDADVSGAAEVGGTFIRLPARSSFYIRVVWRAVTIIGLLAFLTGGLVALWLFRSTAPRAVSEIRTRPWRTLGIGFGAVVLVPVLAVTLVVSLVGAPLGLLLLFVVLLGLFFGPVPALTVGGDRLVRGRFSLWGAFLVGALAWRLLGWLLPLVGLLLYMAMLAWGVGGWMVAAWEDRRERRGPPPAPVPAVVAATPVPDDWDAPFPPAAGSEVEPDETATGPDDENANVGDPFPVDASAGDGADVPSPEDQEGSERTGEAEVDDGDRPAPA